jgi:hypothetical protein
MAHIIEVFEFRKTFDRRLKRTVDGSWPHMCFLQNRPPKYWDTDLPCTYPACTKKDDDNWGSQYCVTIRPPMFGNDIHKPSMSTSNPCAITDQRRFLPPFLLRPGCRPQLPAASPSTLATQPVDMATRRYVTQERQHQAVP